MPTSTRKLSPHERAGSGEVNATVARVAPSILELLADGVPRSKPAIVAALAGRHDKGLFPTKERNATRAVSWRGAFARAP
jgi:hypothetical protein